MFEVPGNYRLKGTGHFLETLSAVSVPGAFLMNKCFQAEKCIYIPVLASTISNRVSMLTRATELMVFGYQVSVTPTKKNINSMASVIRNC